jgi:tRNA pseudouridine55 synthase
MDQPKVYRATARLDITSESFDVDNPTTEVTVEQPPTIDAVREALGKFEGHIMQVPPRISAIKLRGLPAYKRAARGEDFEIKPRPAVIYWMHLHAYAWPEVDFEMCCGRGTYVRSVIRDLGIGLGTGGCLTSLSRTRIGPFKLEASWTIDRIQAAEHGSYLIDLEDAVGMLSDGPVEVPDRPAGAPACSDQPG